MKYFKDILSEVAQPKSPEERRFKDLHKVELIKHPVAPEYVHTGEIEGVTMKKRPADPAKGEDASKYDAAYAQKDKSFKMPRNIDESAENEEVKKQSLSFKGLVEKVSTPDDLLENPQEEIPMMMRQLHFIGYAADEIMEYLAIGGIDPEEWYQNKLAGVFSMMKSLHAYVEGDKRMMDVDDDHLMASYESKEQAIVAGELVLESNETVTITEQEAEILSLVLESLEEESKQDMYSILIQDKESFEEVLGFANEIV